MEITARLHTLPVWRPDWRASAALAFCGAVILFFAFVGMLDQAPPQDARGSLLSLTLDTSAVEPHTVKAVRRVLPSAARSRAASLTAKPPTQTLDPGAFQQQLDEAVQGYLRNEKPEGVFLQPESKEYELDRALRTPPRAETLKDGDGYPSVYGVKVARSGDSCSEQRGVQVGPSVSDNVMLAFSVPCPGAYRPTMADELSAWADGERRRASLPPN